MLTFSLPPRLSSRSARAEPHKDRYVILVSLDGLANFYFDDPRPHAEPASPGRRRSPADGMLCSFPTVTWPNHTTLVTGVLPPSTA